MTNQNDNIANAITELADSVYTMDKTIDTRSDFNGFTIADSIGIIAESFIRIADALENKKDTSIEDYELLQKNVVDLTKEEA